MSESSRSERFFPTLKDVMREFLTPEEWSAIFERKSKLPSPDHRDQ